MPGVEPLAALKESRALTAEGRWEEATQRHLWFHDHALLHQPSLAGVRLSFALADWVALGQLYPPARQALVDIRDRKTAALAAGAGSASLFHNVSAINKY